MKIRENKTGEREAERGGYVNRKGKRSRERIKRKISKTG